MTVWIRKVCDQCRQLDIRPTHCFYCDAPLSPRHEHDHYPVPYARGGNHIVVTCYNCHDLKDRMAMSEWPVEEIVTAVMGLIKVLGLTNDDAAARAISAEMASADNIIDKMIPLWRRVVDHFDIHTTPVWDTIDAPTRLLFAKMCVGISDCVVTTDAEADHRRELFAPWIDPDSERWVTDGRHRVFKGDVAPGRRTPSVASPNAALN